MQQDVLPGEVKALVEKEEALYAAAPLVGGCCQAQAAPGDLTHLLPDMLPLCIWTTISRNSHVGTTYFQRTQARPKMLAIMDDSCEQVEAQLALLGCVGLPAHPIRYLIMDANSPGSVRLTFSWSAWAGWASMASRRVPNSLSLVAGCPRRRGISCIAVSRAASSATVNVSKIASLSARVQI